MSIAVNSVGFLPFASKKATVPSGCKSFRIVNTGDGAVALKGNPGPLIQTLPEDTDETLRVVDFSELRTPGTYQIQLDNGICSVPFKISSDAMNEAFTLVCRAMYLWRCGIEVESKWQGQRFHHAACHQKDGDGSLTGINGAIPATGGWHDAGDYNKYVVNAGVSVGLMLKAWEFFPQTLRNFDLSIPESGNALPDLLNEVRWEIEWLLKMQTPDGRVYHKVSSLNFNYWGVPEGDTEPRYLAGWSTVATADFVGMMALAARIFAEFDQAFSASCRQAAERSWSVLKSHPAPHVAEQDAFSTGGYQAEDPPHRMWAAVEMWELTGDKDYLKAFESLAKDSRFSFIGPTWADVTDLALGSYLLSTRSSLHDPALGQRLREQLLQVCSVIVRESREHAYGRPLGGRAASWFWGCNGSVAAQTYLLHVADRIQPDESYRLAAHDALSHLFGRNPYSRCYVTGLGQNPPQHPHDRRGEPAWPGYLVGGGWPTGKSWVDKTESYQTNEIAINWNASLIYALAAFVNTQ